MDKAWQKKKQEWYNAEIKRRKEIIINGIKNCNILLDSYKKEILEDFISANKYIKLFDSYLKINDGKAFLINDIYCKEYEKLLKEIDVENYLTMFEYKDSYNGMRCLDSDPMEFDGDIIITDPCYITKDGDWHRCGCGSHMEKLGINHYMTRDTLYGDWSCTTYNTDTKEKIGGFCADAGMVSVFLLDEVLKYNPDYKYENDCSVTYIKDFKGTVQFVVVYTDGYYEDETKWHKKGQHWEDYSVEVVGHGIDKVTGEPINFVGKQTGL